MSTNGQPPRSSKPFSSVPSPPPPPMPFTESVTERQMRLHRERLEQGAQHRQADLGNSVLGGIVAGVALGSLLD